MRLSFFYIIIPILVIALGIVLYGFLKSKKKRLNWVVYYGTQLKESQYDNIDWAIVDPDSTYPKKYSDDLKTKFIAYLSVGEAESYRSYWQDIDRRSVIVKKNPNWPDNFLVDIRAPAWQDLLIHKLIPEYIKRGFQGVMLDTIDTPIYLEDMYPQKFKGSKKALLDLIVTIREKFPEILIIPNNGLPHLKDFGHLIDGILVEDLYTRYDFQKKQVFETPVEDEKAKEKFLDTFLKLEKKPVLNILYNDNAEESVTEKGIQKSNAKGYLWYVTKLNLMSLGEVNQ